MRQVDVLAPLLVACLLVVRPVRLDAERLPFKLYSIQDGLPGVWISHIIQDSRGFLWLSTWDGLSRFDGARFVNFGKDDGLPVQHVNALLETRRGVYWVGTNGGGVCRFNPLATARSAGPSAEPLCLIYRTGATVNSNRVNALYEDRAGGVWAGTDDGIFYLAPNDERASFERVELGWAFETQLNGVAFLEDREGSLWIATGRGLLRRLPSGASVHYLVAPQGGRDSIYALLEDHDSNLWVGHYSAGLIILRPDPIAAIAPTQRNVTVDLRQNKPIQSREGGVALPTRPGEWARYTRADGLADDQVSGLRETPDGRIWISAPQGLTAFDGRRFRAYPASALGGHRLRQVASDRQGNLWITTTASGLLKLPQTGFVTYDRVDGVEGHEIRAIYEGPAGAIYVVSHPWWINRFDGARFTAVTPTALASGAPAYASAGGLLDSTGRWWFSSSAGLLRFPPVVRFEQLGDARPASIYGRHSGLSADAIYRAFEDSHGDMWIATGEGLVTRWSRSGERFESFLLPTAGGDRLPSAFGQDESGALWIGFADGRVMRWRAGRFETVDPPDEAVGEFITDFFTDHRGRLWIASGGAGVWRVDEPDAAAPTFRAYTIADGISSNNIRCITEDGWGRMYLGTSRGVDRLEPESGRLRHYTTADGLAGEYVIAALRDRQGRLWFGTMAGLSRLDPQPDSPDLPPLVLITGLRVNGAPYPISALGEQQLRLPALEPDSSHLEIAFASPSSEMGRTLRFQVTLEGASGGWDAPSFQRQRDYARLAAGDYRFLVRAVTDSGLTSAEPASVQFVVLPFWWQRGSVQLAALGMVALAAFAFYRLRVTRLVEAERLRARIATDLHDDVGANLSKIAMLSDTVQREVRDMPDTPKSRLSSIGALARESIDGMADIVWAVDPRRARFADLTQRIRLFADELLAAANIDLVVDIAPGPRDAPLDAHHKHEILLIAKEALTNVVRHAACSRVILRLRAEDGWFVLEIEDDGRGFDNMPRASTGGRGLISMQRRASALAGRVDITSGPNGGTMVRLRVPSTPRRRRRARA